MAFRSIFPALAAVTVMALALPAPTHAGGDAEKGQQLAYTCYGCHGIANYKNVYPTYSVPKLQGQHPDYIVAALLGYRSGERSHSTMHAQAATMSDEDMRDIAAFLAGEVLIPTPNARPEGGLPAKGQLCTSCHGPDGIGITPIYPTLAGQHADYLRRTLLDYKNGARKNPVMAGFVLNLEDKDIRELAEYYATQRPSLTTAEHATWFTQVRK